MVVVLVIWAKTGAALIARVAAIKRVSAGFLRMVLIVARRAFIGADSRQNRRQSAGFAAKKRQASALTTASPI
jgi:hypothetical protein